MSQDVREHGSPQDRGVGANDRNQPVAGESDPSSQGWSSTVTIKQEASHVASGVNQSETHVAAANQVEAAALNRPMPSVEPTSMRIKRERQSSEEDDLEEFSKGNKRARQ